MWLSSKLNKYTKLENYIETDNETHKHNKEERNTTTNKKPEKRQKERTTTQNTKKHKTATLPAGPQKKRPIEQEETMEEATIEEGDNEGTADNNGETLPEQEQTPDFARREIRSNPNKMELSVATEHSTARSTWNNSKGGKLGSLFHIWCLLARVLMLCLHTQIYYLQSTKNKQMIAANTKWFDSFNGIGVRNWSKAIRRQYTAVKLNGVSSPSASDVVDNIVEECFLEAPEVKAAVKKFVADQRAVNASKPSFEEFLEFMLKSFKSGDVFAKSGDLDKIVGRYSLVPAGHYSWRSLTQLITEKNEELQRPLPESELVVYVKDALLQRNMLDAVLQNAAEARRDLYSKDYNVWIGKEMALAGSGGEMPKIVSEEYSMEELAAAILKYVSDRQGVSVEMTVAEAPRSSGIAAAAAGLVPLPPSTNSSRRESLASSSATAYDSDILRELREIRQMFNAIAPVARILLGQGNATGS
ncbi:hypothetical protein BDR26DRAFT_923935, partial [Obelidium mucronatum]